MRAERSEASKYSDARFLQNVAISALHRTFCVLFRLPFPFPLQFRDRHSFFARKREIETSPGSLCGFHRVRLAVSNPFPMPSLHHALSRKMLMSMSTTKHIATRHHGINSTVGGYLNAAASVFGFVLLTLFLRFSESSILCRYPSNMLLIPSVIVLCNASYVAVYEPWIAYSAHWVLRKQHVVILGLEMVSRLYLCPPAAFNKVTSMAGVMKNAGYFLGAVMGPILCMLSECAVVLGVCSEHNNAQTLFPSDSPSP